MTDIRFTISKISGWRRMGLPLALTAMFISPMLWSLGVFDSTADPMIHALIFGMCFVILFGSTPALFGWAMQGFAVRRKVADENDEQDRPGLRSVAGGARVKPH